LTRRLPGELQRARRKGDSAWRQRRAEVHAVQKRNEDWWECVDHSCGQKIQFLMLDGMPNRAKPTCFCGSDMKRSYVKPHFTRHESTLPMDTGAPIPATVSFRLFVLPLDAMTCLLPGPEA